MTSSTSAQAPAAVTDEPGTEGQPRRPSGRDRIRVNWWLTALMVVLALTVLIPLYFAVVTALKTPEQMAGTGFGLPRPARWANFVDAWRLTNYPRAALNSAIITGARWC